MIPEVREIDDALFSLGRGFRFQPGNGGMVTKLHAAAVAQNAGIPTVIMQGARRNGSTTFWTGNRWGPVFCHKPKRRA